jgi:hypothetical protein
MSRIVSIFIVCAVPAMICSAIFGPYNFPGIAMTITAFSALAAVTLPVCYAIIHAAELRNEEES